MKNLSKSSISGLLAISIVLAGTNVSADDTDIFINKEVVVGAFPNILFITDTSGSMGTNDVKVAVAAYNPATTYAGSYNVSAYYYARGAIPSRASRNYPLSSNIGVYCKDLPGQVATTGKYEGDLIGLHDFTNGYDRYSGWWDLEIGKGYGNRYRAIECLSDYGNHGPDSASNRMYPTRSRSSALDRPSNTDAWVRNSNDAFDYGSRNTYGGIYVGNYLNYLASVGDTTTTRLKAVQGVLDSLISSMNNVNFGLMSFDRLGNARGGQVDYPVDVVEGNRNSLKNVVNNYGASGNTPLGETLYEAARYFRGDTIAYGGLSHPGAKSSITRYKSPINNECQASAIIYLTDGTPTSDDNRTTIGQYIGETCLGGNCMDEIAGFLANEDQRPDLDGDQTVRTFTVGFKADFPLLTDTATAGKGEHFTVDDPDDLAVAIRNIVEKVSQEGASFTAPGISVNFFGSLENNDEVYYSLFQPEGTDRWSGNLKRYRIGFDANSKAVIFDAKDKVAINPDDSKIYDTAVSVWSTITDGAEVAIGGAAGRQGVDRNIYTFIGDDPGHADLTAASNLVTSSNTRITKAMLTAADDSERKQLLDFAQGYDVNNELKQGTGASLQHISDPLHSQPTVLQYRESGNYSTAIFFGTNGGNLNAIDAENGNEIFSFIPEELLPNLKPYLNNSASTSDKVYGFDGEIELWVNDINGNGYIQTNAGVIEKSDKGNKEGAYLFAGMRRGGSQYYALDVSEPTKPKLMWKIGPEGDFAEIGQTWARPQFSFMNVAGQKRATVVLAGGYDELQDSVSTKVGDSKGRAIYIVDAFTGKLIWSVGYGPDFDVNAASKDMLNSFPAAPAVLDVNGDGLTDTIIASDSGGRIWRIDIDKDNTGVSSFASNKVELIADLSDDGDASDNRRFFATPDVSIDSKIGSLVIAIGSGRRPDPLGKEVQDRLSVIKSAPIYGPKLDGSKRDTITASDLLDVTNSAAVGSADAAAKAKLRGAGFYIDMQGVGEKILGDALIINGFVIAGSYTPNNKINVCGSNLGSNKLYVVDLDSPDKVVEIPLPISGIAARPTPITIRDPITGKRKTVITVGTTIVDEGLLPTGFDEQYTSREDLIKFWVED